MIKGALAADAKPTKPKWLGPQNSTDRLRHLLDRLRQQANIVKAKLRPTHDSTTNLIRALAHLIKIKSNL